jgi:hypothetical protein
MGVFMSQESMVDKKGPDRLEKRIFRISREEEKLGGVATSKPKSIKRGELFQFIYTTRWNRIE